MIFMSPCLNQEGQEYLVLWNDRTVVGTYFTNRETLEKFSFISLNKRQI